jgi:hypothetical protein
MMAMMIVFSTYIMKPPPIERRGKIALSKNALAICVESTQKVYQVGAEKSGLCFYSIPINGINRVFFIPKPGRA